MKRNLLKFKQVSSTQDVLRRFVNNKKEMAVFAYRQTRGRGRHKREWFSPTGGLYLSILVFPEKYTNSIPIISCLSVIETLKELDLNDPSIHWPNDVLLNKKKVCGILCEKIDSALICGIGLNVNIKKFPSKLINATSLHIETGRIYSIEKVLNLCLKNFWKFYDSLQADKFNIGDVYQYISGIGEPVIVKLSSRETVCGVIHNVDEDWSLLVRTAEGLIIKIRYGDVIRLV